MSRKEVKQKRMEELVFGGGTEVIEEGKAEREGGRERERERERETTTTTTTTTNVFWDDNDCRGGIIFR